MASVAPPYDRDSLSAKGWQQGSLLPVEALVRLVVWISGKEQGWSKARKDAKARSRSGDLPAAYLYERPSKQTDRFALITQECDVLKAPDEYPIVEFALVFQTSSEDVIREADSLTSARYLRIGELVAGSPVAVLDYRYKAQAEKGLLVEHDPDNTLVSGMTDARGSILREWLGRRLGREAVSDDDTNRIVEPIRTAWKDLAEAEPETAIRWGAMTSELRFRHSDGARLRFYVVTHDAVDSADPDVLEMVAWAIECLEWAENLIDVTITNEWTMTIGEHRATQEIDLTWASYEEDAAA